MEEKSKTETKSRGHDLQTNSRPGEDGPSSGLLDLANAVGSGFVLVHHLPRWFVYGHSHAFIFQHRAAGFMDNENAVINSSGLIVHLPRPSTRTLDVGRPRCQSECEHFLLGFSTLQVGYASFIRTELACACLHIRNVPGRPLFLILRNYTPTLLLCS